MILRGIPLSGGIGLGRAVCAGEEAPDCAGVPCAGRDAETARLQAAIDRFRERTSAMAARLEEQAGRKESEILTSQITMLEDPTVISEMQDAIDAGACAEVAADRVLSMYADLFAGLEDELTRQRAADVRDIRSRLLRLLLGMAGADPDGLPPGSVLVVRELTPSMAAGLNRENVTAILTAAGGRTSHSAILARALGLPAVSGVPGLMELVKDGDGVIVDGEDGIAVLHPDERTWNEYLARQEAGLARRAALQIYRDRETVDADGKRYRLYANIGSPAEAEAAVQSGTEGVGLFRTEFLFMNRASLPDEATQYEAYRAVSRAMSGREVIIRTLDVGGDKNIEYLSMDREENPALGCRAIRYCLDRPELYRAQLRALLRAGAEEENIRILLPLVTCVEEVRAVRELLEVCKRELEEAHLPYDRDIALGVMIETPAAALASDLLARECDFFSIGTNDLTQYMMAADRGNARVEKLCSHFQPAVLRAIRQVIAAARAAGIPVCLCGEAAADPRMLPLLMSWGLDRFSVSVSDLLTTRASISRWRGCDAERVAGEAMKLSTASGVEAYLTAALPR